MPDDFYGGSPQFQQSFMSENIQQQQLIQKWMLDNTEELTNLEHNLRGEVFDPILKKWIPPVEYKPLVNNRGLYSTMLLLNSYLSKNYMLSNLTEDDINHIMLDVVETMTGAMYMNWRDWELDIGNWKKYLMIVEHFVYAIINRSRDHLQLDLTAQTNRYNETHVIREGQPDFMPKKQFKLFGGGN